MAHKKLKSFWRGLIYIYCLSYLLNTAKRLQTAENYAWYDLLYKNVPTTARRENDKKWQWQISDSFGQRTNIVDWKQNILFSTIIVFHVEVHTKIYFNCYRHIAKKRLKMSSAVGLNLLPPPISTSSTGVSSPPATQHTSTDKTNLEINDISIGKDHKTSQSSSSNIPSNDVKKSNVNNVSNSLEMENNLNESDANHNSEHHEGK